MNTKFPGSTCRASRKNSGNCGCGSMLLAMLLLPIITSNPIIGLLILFILISSKK